MTYSVLPCVIFPVNNLQTPIKFTVNALVAICQFIFYRKICRIFFFFFLTMWVLLLTDWYCTLSRNSGGISGRERMTVENISWSNLHERMLYCYQSCVEIRKTFNVRNVLMAPRICWRSPALDWSNMPRHHNLCTFLQLLCTHLISKWTHNTDNGLTL